MAEKNLSAIGQKILFSSRNELYMNMPYLDEALCSLYITPGEETTATAATDGEKLYYNGSFTAERYLRGNAVVNRLYLHIILHCMLRHLFKKKGRDGVLWDLACDTAVESIIDDLPYACIKGPGTPVRQKFYGECLREMKVLTAEAIYRKLQRDRRSEYEIAMLQRAFLEDDHGLWDLEKKDDDNQSQRQDEKWQNISSKSQTNMETTMSRESNGGEAVLEQVSIAARDDVDYRAFLRRFAAPREVMKSDVDGFDYIYYTYGLSHYGNMPLIEHPETKEEKRIENLVIAIDTSMSTSGELVKEFLRCTYSILRSIETFTQKFNIHIIQCDDTVRSDTVITGVEELKAYMNDFHLTGGSATDFRPVFEHVAQLKKGGAFGNLRGLIYFTDGMGIYPQKRPDYETAFIFLEEPPLSVKVPPWCIKLMLDAPMLDEASEGIGDEWYDNTEDLPEL